MIKYQYRDAELRTTQGFTAIAAPDVTSGDFDVQDGPDRPPFRGIWVNGDTALSVRIGPEYHSEDSEYITLNMQPGVIYPIFGRKILTGSTDKTGFLIGW